MNPKPPLSPKEITALLAQMQPTGQGYPPELLERRRAAYLQQAASLPIAPGVLSGKAFKNLHKNFPKNLHAGVTSTLGTVIQAAVGLVVAGLVVTAAIVYREEIVDFFTPDAGAGGVVSAEEASPLLPAATPTASSLLTKPLTPTEPSPTSSSPTPTPTRTGRLYLTRTPTPTPSRTPAPVQVQATPTSNGGGKHLGQTPTPPAQRKTPKP